MMTQNEKRFSRLATRLYGKSVFLESWFFQQFEDIVLVFFHTRLVEWVDAEKVCAIGAAQHIEIQQMADLGFIDAVHRQAHLRHTAG